MHYGLHFRLNHQHWTWAGTWQLHKHCVFRHSKSLLYRKPHACIIYWFSGDCEAASCVGFGTSSPTERFSWALICMIVMSMSFLFDRRTEIFPSGKRMIGAKMKICLDCIWDRYRTCRPLMHSKWIFTGLTHELACVPLSARTIWIFYIFRTIYMTRTPHTGQPVLKQFCFGTRCTVSIPVYGCFEEM